MDLRTIKPKTLEEAADFIVANLSDSDRQYLKENSAVSAHHGFGTALRNEWGLWHDSELAQHFKTQYGLGHADDMSGLILGLVGAIVKGTTFDIAKDVDKYKNHWLRLGINPLTQERI